MVDWIPVAVAWPQKHRMVLVATDKFESSAPAVNVGYMKYAAGDLDCPYFVCPGAQRGFKPLYWSDCLGDDFMSPNWYMRQPPKLEARCKGCGQIVETMWSIPSHANCQPFEIAYKEQSVHRCPTQACCREEGHAGNHRCSVCNWPHRLDATEAEVSANETYDEHECYPPNRESTK